MAKPNNIRKRALEYAKKRHWDKALEEFQRLAEIEQHNPNLYNEIGDLHLKLGQKREAFQSYHAAVDAYSRVSLHNNAVAVCKKILRLNPNDRTVCGKLATLRQRQGFHKDAVAHALTFFDRISDGDESSGDHLKDLIASITRAVGDSAEVLERAAEYLITHEINDEAGTVLEKLEQIYANKGLTEQQELVRRRMESIGHVSAVVPGGDIEPEKLETVESHRNHFAVGGDRYGGPSSGDRDGGDAISGAPERTEDDVRAQAGEYGMVELGAGRTAPVNGDATEPTGELLTEPVPSENHVGVPVEDREFSGDPREAAAGTEPVDSGENEWVIPEEDDSSPASDVDLDDETLGNADNSVGRLASEVTADIDEDDYRSHYDLGMAYLEMNLLTEAIREFQYASNSSMYRVRSLEMIGRCFLQQNKPQLAIKQLTRGIALVESNDEKDSLGIRYSLGLAYEMIGDIEKARTFFEDVYVVDVTFRDVAEKMEKYAS